MSISATVILDSGALFRVLDRSTLLIGCFQSDRFASDIRIYVDGEELKFSENVKLGKKCLIEVRHVKANGSIGRNGVTESSGFHGSILSLTDLYGFNQSLDPAKFDCLIRFDSGHFRESHVKLRRFKQRKIQAGGKYAYSASDKIKQVKRPIAHDVAVDFRLSNGEALEFTRNDRVFWSSRSLNIKSRLEVEILADNTTAEKFYRTALREKQDSYWLPNEGDPPPYFGASGGFALQGVPVYPDPIYECPRKHGYEIEVAEYSRRNPPLCPIHQIKLTRKK